MLLLSVPSNPLQQTVEAKYCGATNCMGISLTVLCLQRDYSGKMGFTEFKELWTVINQWKQTFIHFDADRSGTIDGLELQNAVRSFGMYQSK